MKKIMLICNTDGALLKFRGPLISFLKEKNIDVLAVCPAGDFANELIEIGARVKNISLSRHSITIHHNILYLIHLCVLVFKERPDVVHSFTHKPAIYGSFAARLAGVRSIVVTITGLGTYFIRDDYVSRLIRHLIVLQYRLFVPKTAVIFFQNSDDQDELVAYGLFADNEKVITNGSGIDLEEYKLPSIPAISSARESLASELGYCIENRTIVLFPARGVIEKGLVEFYETARLLSSSFPSRFVFIHLGLMEGELNREFAGSDAGEIADKHNVKYLGFRHDPTTYFHACDIVCLPSYREGVPRSLIEGLAFGKCIVASNVAGCRETVIDDWNGFLFEPFSSQALGDALLRVDSKMISECRSRSRRYCEIRFDVMKLNELTYELYERAA